MISQSRWLQFQSVREENFNKCDKKSEKWKEKMEGKDMSEAHEKSMANRGQRAVNEK